MISVLASIEQFCGILFVYIAGMQNKIVSGHSCRQI